MISFIYTTVPSSDCAAKLAYEMLEVSGVLCVNYFAINSVYEWNGIKESASENAMIFKVRDESVDYAMQELELKHVYDVPFIASFNADAVGEIYADWLSKM